MITTHLLININIITDKDIITYQKKLNVIYILLFIVKIHKIPSIIIAVVGDGEYGDTLHGCNSTVKLHMQ